MKRDSMHTTHSGSSQIATAHSSPWLLFRIFLRLGLTCFGGPAAHLGYFRDEFVKRRQWIDEPHTAISWRYASSCLVPEAAR
jgi:hypothetical protein